MPPDTHQGRECSTSVESKMCFWGMQISPEKSLDKNIPFLSTLVTKDLRPVSVRPPSFCRAEVSILTVPHKVESLPHRTLHLMAVGRGRHSAPVTTFQTKLSP